VDDRRPPTYADKFVDLISTQTLPYHFRDGQAHVTYAFTPTTKLAFTAYEGRDVLEREHRRVWRLVERGRHGRDVLVRLGQQRHGRDADEDAVVARSRRAWTILLGDSTVLEQRASLSRFSTELDLARDR
jgi:hypothetical protein